MQKKCRQRKTIERKTTKRGEKYLCHRMIRIFVVYGTSMQSVFFKNLLKIIVYISYTLKVKMTMKGRKTQ